jgi:hypothetical protein
MQRVGGRGRTRLWVNIYREVFFHSWRLGGILAMCFVWRGATSLSDFCEVF